MFQRLLGSASGPGIPAVFDVLFSGACLVCLAPIVLLIAMAIRIDSRGPILYSQMRIGQGGRPFRLYKFRKFHHQAPVAGGALTVANDPRLTRVGWFLERTKLDELPQLWNIVRGEMSVVVPRPETPHFAISSVADSGRYWTTSQVCSGRLRQWPETRALFIRMVVTLRSCTGPYCSGQGADRSGGLSNANGDLGRRLDLCRNHGRPWLVTPASNAYRFVRGPEDWIRQNTPKRNMLGETS